MANADRTQLQIAKEAAGSFGTNPGSGFEFVRFTSESLTRETSTTTSAIIRSDRNVEDVVRTSISSSCELSQELELPATGKIARTMISAAVGHADDNGTAYGTMTTRVQGTSSVAIAGHFWNDASPGSGNPQHGWRSTNNDFTETAWQTPGNWFRVLPKTTSSEAAAPAKISGGNYFRVYEAGGDSGGNSATVIDVEGSKLLEDITVAAGDTFQPASRVMDNGVAEKSFSIEKQHLDVTTDIINGLGMTVDTWTLSVSPENIITSTFSLAGQNSSQQAALSSGGTVASTGEILNAVDHVSGVYASTGPNDSSADGTFPENRLRPLDGVTAFELTISNGLRARSQVGLLGPKSFGQAAISVTGSLSVYYDAESSDMIEKLYEGFEDGHLAIALEEKDVQALTLADSGITVNTKALVIDMPRVKFTGATRHATGTGSDVMAELTFTAFYDGAGGSSANETVSLHWFDD